MANEVIGIEVQVKLEQLRSQLATLGPGMEKEAKAMTAALNREIKQQTAAMKRLGSEAATSSGEFSKLSGTVSKTAQVSGALGGMIGKLNPEIGEAVTSVGSFTGAMQGLHSAGVLSMAMLGPLAGAVILVGAAYLYYSHELEEAEAAQRKMADAATAAQTAHEGLESVVRDVTDAYEIAAGITTKAAVGQREQIAKVTAAFEVEKKAIDGSAMSADMKALALESLDAKQRGTIALIKETTELEQDAKAKAEAAAAAKAAAADASRKAADDATKAAEAAAMEQKANADAAAEELAVSKMIEKNRDEVTTRQLARLDEEEEAEKRARAYVTKVVQGNLDEQEKSAEEAAAFIRSVASESTAALDSLLGAMHQFASLAADEAAEAAEKAADRLSNIRGLLAELTAEQVDASTLTGDALVKAYKRGEVGVEDLTDTQKASVAAALSAQEDAAAKRARSERKAAKKAWDMQQALSVGQTFAAGAVALIQAFAQLGPVAGGIAAIGIAAATAASIATITSQKPSFHSGGVVGGSANGQGEVSARLLPGEALLNRQATNALGPSGVAALNSGASMGAVSLRIGRLEAREIVRTDVAAGGLIVRTAKAAAASAGNTAGRTGRRPIA